MSAREAGFVKLLHFCRGKLSADAGIEGKLSAAVLCLGEGEGRGVGRWTDDLAAGGADRFSLCAETWDELFESGHGSKPPRRCGSIGLSKFILQLEREMERQVDDTGRKRQTDAEIAGASFASEDGGARL